MFPIRLYVFAAGYHYSVSSFSKSHFLSAGAIIQGLLDEQDQENGNL